MTTIKVKTALRKKKRDLKNALGDDILRYIAELVTNADDSYRRRKTKGIDSEHDNIIYIELQKERRSRDSEGENYTITVTDNAEGMTLENLEKIFGMYADDNASGIEHRTRGIFGQGASDVLQGASTEKRTACIESIKDGRISKLKYNMDDELNPEIDTEELNLSSTRLNDYRNSLKIIENGTKISFGIPSTVKFNKKIKNNLAESISKYPSFRYLLNQNDRKVVYIDNEANETILSSAEFQFKEDSLIAEENFSMNFEGKRIRCKLKLYLNENKKTDGTNIIVIDENNCVFDNTMFDFQNNAAAQNVSGELLIFGLYNLCYEYLNFKETAIISDNRTGFDTKNTFYLCLNKTISPIIDAVLKEICKNIQTTDITNNKKFNDALKELNKYLQTELKDTIHGGDLKGFTPPVEGIKFARSVVTITKGKQYDLKLFINDEIISSEDTIQIICEENDFIEVSPSAITYSREESDNGLVTKSILIKALENTSELVIITAIIDSRIATVAVEVVDVEIHYPENGLEFYPKELVLTYDKPHIAKLYIDSDIVPLESEIKISCEGLHIDKEILIFKSSSLLNDTIGMINVVLSGGEANEIFSAKALYKELSTTVKITLIESSKNDNLGGGLISGLELEPNTLPHQAYYHPHTQKIIINSQNPINVKIMGEMKELNPQNPKFNKEQIRYLCDIISTQAAILLVKRKEIKNNDINFEDHEEAVEHIQNSIQKYKNEIYQRMHSVLIASAEFNNETK